MDDHKMFTSQQTDEIYAYALAKEHLADALSQGQYTLPRQQWVEKCIEYLIAVGVSQEEADTYIASRNWFRENGLFVDLDEPGAPSEAQLRAYGALKVAAESIGHNNYCKGLYIPKRAKNGKILRGYEVTKEHIAVINAMAEVMKGSMSPEAAMDLLNTDEVVKQRES